MAEAIIQPQGYARLNPSSRIAMAAHAIVLGSAEINLATGLPLAGAGAIARTSVKEGVPFALRFNAYRMTEVGPAIPANQASVEFWVGYPSNNGVGGSQGNSSNPPPTFVTGSSANQTGIYMQRGSGYGDGGMSSSWGYLTVWASVLTNAQDALVIGRPRATVLMVVRRPASMEFWRDGILVNTVVRAAEAIPAQTFICGAFIPDNFWTTTSDTLLAGRALIDPTTSEIRAFSANPWMLFDDPNADDVETVAAAAVYTLSGAGAAFVVTGLPAKVTASRRLAGFTAQLALVGASATFTAARRLAAASAGLALSTGAAALLSARRMSGATAAMSIVGSSAGLLAARRLPAAPGTVVVASGAAGLLAARKLVTQPAAFTVTASAAAFVYTPVAGGMGPTYTLSAGSSTFALSTSAARLLLARRLVAAVGAFSLGGSPVVLNAARRLPVGAAAFATAGPAAGLRAARRLSTAAASFSLSGATATFFYSPIGAPSGPTYTLTALGGALGLTGTGIGMRVVRRLSGGPGLFVVTGSAAGLTIGQKIVYARAPAGSGYTPRTTEVEHRPASSATTRPGANQRNNR